MMMRVKNHYVTRLLNNLIELAVSDRKKVAKSYEGEFQPEVKTLLGVKIVCSDILDFFCFGILGF